MSITLVDPTTADTETAFAQASRPATLDGARIALLANGKTHGEFLLRQVIANLATKYDIAETRVWAKPHPSGPPTPAQLAEIREFATVVLSAIGDCGSCSSCSVFDGMNFERLGIPSAIVISKPFLPTAAAIAKLNGAEQFRVIAITHPVTSKQEAALIADAAEAAPQIEDVLLNGHDVAPAAITQSDGLHPDRDAGTVAEILDGFRDALSNDGTDIQVVDLRPEHVELKLITSGAACADCVLPVSMISAMLQSEFESRFGPGLSLEVTDDRT